MDILRWILLIFGIVLIAGVYFTGRRKHPDVVQRKEPGLDAEHYESDDEGEEADDFEVEADDRRIADTDEDSFDFERLLADERDSTSPAPARIQTKDSRHPLLLEDEFVVLHLTVPS